jgi:uncharacterized OB-fold protein
LCPVCGGRDWDVARIREGVVEEVTTVQRAAGRGAVEARAIATVRLPGGQRVIAALDRALPPDTPVTLAETGGAVRARRNGHNE